MAPELVRELLELAVLAPNHHETEPWRFWVVGRDTLNALSEATGDKKLLRSHTAIVVGVKRDADAQMAEEDYAAVSCAIQNIMLAARARGLASFWRTPGVLSRPVVATILDVPEEGAPDRRRAPRAGPASRSRRSPSAANIRAGSASSRRLETRVGAPLSPSIPSVQPTSKPMPWASGRSLEPLIVFVWRRM